MEEYITMKVLVINCGSSSVKYQIIDSENENLLCKGIIELFEGNSSFSYTKTGCEKIKKELPIEDTAAAIKLIIDAVTDKDTGCISDVSEIGAVGHRVVHGGEDFDSSVLVTDEVMAKAKANIDLAPLHNPANIAGIEACRALMPDVPMVATFDTAFHQTMKPEAYLYAIPYKYYEDYRVRKYGFHGTSHLFVSEQAAELLGKDKKDTKIITCHIGNGGSCSAVLGGKCIDTSMGLTPLEGLVMGTRSGDIDPSVITYIMEKENLTAEEVMEILNKKSGLLGITGLSNDMRIIDEAAEKKEGRAELALEMFARRVKGYIGNYLAQLNGADAIVFTAGVGENDSLMRKMICTNMEGLGIKIDIKKNDAGEETISTDDSAIKVFVIPTNEELVIARDTARIVG